MKELDEEIISVKLTKSQKERYGHGSSNCHKVNGEYPYKWARRVLRKYVGKSYDEAFAHYCTLVPDYQQKFFIHELELSKGYWTPDNHYIVDNKGLIQIMPKEAKNSPVIFQSYDYKEGYKNKRDGNIVIPKTKWYDNDRDMRYVRIYPDRYDTIIVSGYKKEFESDKDREYIRLMKEKVKLKRLDEKNKKKEKTKVDYSFLSKEEAQRKAEIATDLIKIKKHGFDEITSFRS